MQGESFDQRLEKIRASSANEPTLIGLAHKAAPLAKAFAGRIPSQKELQDITRELGVDIASMVFLLAVREAEPYGTYLRKLNSIDLDQSLRERASTFEVTVVSSSLFQSGREWGDHVESWRAWARELGFTTDVIETRADASIPDNARLIHEHLLSKPHPQRILVSYSQGSAEYRFHLDKLAGGDAFGVRAWINVCGAVHGASSSLAITESRLKRLFEFWLMRKAGRTRASLFETDPRSAVWRRAVQIPKGMMVVNLLGLPLRGEVHDRLKAGYRHLAQDVSTPNDGVVGVNEAIAQPGFIVPIEGMSHRAEAIKIKPVLQRAFRLATESE